MAERSMPVVLAIQSFVDLEKRLPNQWGDLIPAYLENVPKTEMGAYPDYELVLAIDGKSIAGNDWILKVNCIWGLLPLDWFVYYPNGNYSKSWFNGNLQDVRRVNDWAYVHFPD